MTPPLGGRAPALTASTLPPSPFGHVARLGGWVNTRELRPPAVRPNHLAASWRRRVPCEVGEREVERERDRGERDRESGRERSIGLSNTCFQPLECTPVPTLILLRKKGSRKNQVEMARKLRSLPEEIKTLEGTRWDGKLIFNIKRALTGTTTSGCGTAG